MKYFAGIDLGGTAAKVGLVNPDGEILKQVSVGIDNRDRFINIVTSIADMLAVMIRDTPGELTAKEIFARAGEGDVFAEDAVDEAARAVARVFGILINLLNPEAFIIGGGGFPGRRSHFKPGQALSR